MPSKTEEYLALAQRTSNGLTRYWESWTDYLTTASRLYSETDNTELAYKSIEDLCAAFPLDLRYRVLLGDLYEQSGHHEMALNTYRDVLAAEPDNSYAQLSLLAYYKAAEADSLYMDLLQRVVFSPGTQTDTRVEALRGFAQDNLQNGGDTTVVVQLFDRVMQMPQDNRDVAMLYLSYMVTTGICIIFIDFI